MTKNNEESKIIKFTQWLTSIGTDGLPALGFCSSEELANEYIWDDSYESDDDRVSSLIRWETSKTFGSGFITGLGGIVTLPVTIPAALAAAYVVQARLVGAIAKIYGFDLKNDRVKTAILLTLIGGSAENILKNAGVEISKIYAKKLISQLPRQVLIKINHAIGKQIVTKSGTRGIVNLTRMVPLVGGLVGGTVDAVSTRIVGYAAKKAFGCRN